jgi:cytochrome P450
MSHHTSTNEPATTSSGVADRASTEKAAVPGGHGTSTAHTSAGSGPGRLSLYDLQRPAVIADPWPWHWALLAADGLCWDPTVRSWLAGRHADVSRLLADPQFSAVTDHARSARSAPAAVRHLFPLLDAHVSFVDPPEHTRLRRILADPFKPRHVEALEGFIAAAVAAALDRTAATGHIDVVTDLAYRIPLQVIQHLLGLDEVDLPTLRRWSNAWGDVVAAPGHLPTGDTTRLLDDVNDLIDHLHRTVAAHRAEPRDTVTAGLVAATDTGRISEVELIANLMMLVTAGHETTANLIGNAVAALLDHPGLADRLRHDSDLLPAAVDELARLYPPTQYTARTARAEVRIGDAQIQPGQAVVLVLAAANRDPGAFPDPDTLRLNRPATPRHVAFGHGPHFCFGAPLACLETRLVLAGLLDRCTELRPAGTPRWRLNGNLRGLASLPVAFIPTDVDTVGQPHPGGRP